MKKTSHEKLINLNEICKKKGFTFDTIQAVSYLHMASSGLDDEKKVWLLNSMLFFKTVELPAMSIAELRDYIAFLQDRSRILLEDSPAWMINKTRLLFTEGAESAKTKELK